METLPIINKIVYRGSLRESSILRVLILSSGGYFILRRLISTSFKLRRSKVRSKKNENFDHKGPAIGQKDDQMVTAGRKLSDCAM